MIGPRPVARSLERRLYAWVRDPAAAHPAADAIVPWDVSRLAGGRFCLLVSHRRDGTPVATPMWLGIARDRVYVRSEAGDGKVKRIQRDERVLVAPCNARGRPTGPIMEGAARLLEQDDCAVAERALREHQGVERRVYGVLRASWLDAVYVEIRKKASAA